MHPTSTPERGSHVHLVGRFAVATPTGSAGADELRAGQARTLVALLATRGAGPVSAEDAAAALWGDAPPPSWRPMIRGLVLRVRDFLAVVGGDARLESTPEGYRLLLPEPVVVDSTDLARTVDALEAATERTGPSHDRVEELTEATRPTFLPGASGPWVEQRRDEVDDLHVRALVLLGAAHLEAGDAGRALGAAEAAIARDPLRESAHRLAMRAHAAAGEAARVAAAFERCRHVLRKRAGVRPSEQTRELYATLVDEA